MQYSNGVLVVHNMISATALCPHISLVVDCPVTLKPGSELLTVAIGPREEGWKPFGATVEPLTQYPLPGEGADDDDDDVWLQRNMNSRVRKSAPAKPAGGCPILVQTDKHVKFLTQVRRSCRVCGYN